MIWRNPQQTDKDFGTALADAPVNIYIYASPKTFQNFTVNEGSLFKLSAEPLK